MLKQSIKRGVLLKNIVSGEVMRVDITGEKDIDGKAFYIVSLYDVPLKQVLLPKTAYSIVKR